ncbi:MAG: cytochrome c peroxidase [Bacteroidia bacterium]
MRGRRWIVFGLALALLSSCQLEGRDEPVGDLAYQVDLPPHFEPMPVPPDNALTTERVALGKRLFHDPILSRDGSISCSSCHLQAFAFSDTAQFSKGIEGRRGFRNAPALFNLAWHPYFFMDGGVPTLELQVLAPIDNHAEMDEELLNVIDRLKADIEYPTLFRRAYGREPDPYGLVRAIAAYERSLVSATSVYDQYLQGIDLMSPDMERGMALFNGTRLRCGSCHSGPNLTDYQFYNIGLPVTTADSGRMRVTLSEADRGAYKTPSLRNVYLTAPYMHDGSMSSLDEVFDHFASGGAHYPNQDPRTAGVIITPEERAALKAFFYSLTDDAFVRNPEH